MSYNPENEKRTRIHTNGINEREGEVISGNKTAVTNSSRNDRIENPSPCGSHSLILLSGKYWQWMLELVGESMVSRRILHSLKVSLYSHREFIHYEGGSAPSPSLSDQVPSPALGQMLSWAPDMKL